MMHHDSRPYEVAVSDAAKAFKTKLEGMIHTSVERVERVIEQVEKDIPEDTIVAGRKLLFNSSSDGHVRILFGGEADAQVLTIHDHALQQITARPKIRHFGGVINDMLAHGEWGRALVAHNLNEVYSHMNGQRFLLRSVRGELRGFLSDQFRRLDSRPLLEAFIGQIEKTGARPVDGFALGTKINVRAILPYVFEPFPGEIMAFGAQLSDSDFGDGKLMLSGFVMRMWCTNLATTEDVLSQIHLGKRLSDDVVFSQKTMELDTQAMASAIKDCASHVLGAGSVNNYLDLVRRANAEKIDSNQITSWVKKNLTGKEGERAVEKFNSADIETLPAGQTSWRWSNAVSWLARETENEHRKLELQDLAGMLLPKAA